MCIRMFPLPLYCFPFIYSTTKYFLHMYVLCTVRCREKSSSITITITANCSASPHYAPKPSTKPSDTQAQSDLTSASKDRFLLIVCKHGCRISRCRISRRIQEEPPIPIMLLQQSPRDNHSVTLLESYQELKYLASLKSWLHKVQEAEANLQIKERKSDLETQKFRKDKRQKL